MKRRRPGNMGGLNLKKGGSGASGRTSRGRQSPQVKWAQGKDAQKSGK